MAVKSLPLGTGSSSSNPGGNVIYSSSYGLVGDDSTDNAVPMAAFMTAIQTAAASSAYAHVEAVLQPGYYRTSVAGFYIPGKVNFRFVGDARVRYTGTDFTQPLFIHGETAVITTGCAYDVNVDNLATHSFMNRNYIGWKAFNRGNSYIRIRNIVGFSIGIQLAADNSCSYNVIDVGCIGVCQTEIEFNCLVVGTAFVSENAVRGGNIISTSSFGNHGSCSGMVFTREFETGYTGHSGNYWYKASFQLQGIGLAWAPSTTLTVDRRYYAALTGTEWLCKTGGTSGVVQPSIEPTGSNRIDLTAITTAVGNAQITVSSTAGISAGWHMRGVNPMSNFPFNTYVLTVDDATHLTMTNPAASASSTYKATFIAPTTDNAATLVYVGPYRRSLLWHRASGAANGIWDSRDEGGIGEQFLISGNYLWPQSTPVVMSFAGSVTTEGHSRANANDVRMPLWIANTAYVSGDMTRPTLMAGYYWECITGGTSHATTEPIMAGTAGKTTVDNGVTWIEKAIPIAGVTRGDFGNYCGFLSSPNGVIRDVHQVGEGTTASIVNAQFRGIGSASGWLVQGFNKLVSNVPQQTFAAGDFKLARDGLLFGAVIVIGYFIRTDQQHCFRYNKVLGTYKRHRGALYAFDKAFTKKDMRTTHSATNPKIMNGIMTITGAFALSDTSDAAQESDTFMVGNDVPYVWISVALGTTGTPIACTFSGIEITALPYTGYPSSPSPRAEVFALYGMSEGPRASLGTPTSGFFLSKGEYIQNAAVTAGASAKGWRPITAGILAPQWLPGVTYVKNEIVTDSVAGRAYAANGSFNSGLAFTFTAALTAATSGTLSATWTFATGSYTVLFSDASTRVCTFTNGATTCTWAGAVTATANATVGTLPSGTGLNFLDTTAQSIVSGDVATWDYIGPLAVLTAEEDTNALFVAGNTGATPTPNCQSGLTQTWTMNQSATFAAPTNAPSVGSILTLIITSSGVFTATFNATYVNAVGTNFTLAVAANAQVATVSFMYTGAKWQFIGGSTQFA